MDIWEFKLSLKHLFNENATRSFLGAGMLEYFFFMVSFDPSGDFQMSHISDILKCIHV